MRTVDLVGPALDWAVAKCEEIPVEAPGWNNRYLDAYAFSTDWAQGGPIIERERIELTNWAIEGWLAKATDYSQHLAQDEVFAEGWGETALIAAMRCYVASKLGAEVEIPEELQ